MNNIVNSGILFSSLILFGLAFTKICVMDIGCRIQKVSSLLFILASVSFAGRIVFPKEINMLWVKIAILSLIIGTFLWIIGDRRSGYERRKLDNRGR